MEKYRSKNIIAVTFCILVLLSILIIPLIKTEKEIKVYDNTIRLHVIANSDDESDQDLKLHVRDEILKYVSGFISSKDSFSESEAMIRTRLNNIKRISENTVDNYGYNYPVEVRLEEEYYPTCEYEGVRLPEGRYTSLKVMIGEAEGHNWWCVLYPALCTSTAKPQKELTQAGFTEEEIRILTESEDPEYKIKFKIIELFSEIVEKFKR